MAHSLLFFWVFVFSCFLTQSPLDAAMSETFETEGFDSRELKLKLSYGIGHSLEEAEFRPRGAITIRNFKGPKYSTQQENIPDKEIRTLQEMASEDAYYFFSATVQYPNGEKVFSSFASARAVLDSGFSDVVSIHLVPTGEIFSISYSLARNTFPSKQAVGPRQYNTTVLVHSGEIGPVPDTAAYLEKMEMERIARERGDEGRDNRSFLSKYWMYIVPVALLILLSGASNPEGGS